MSCCGKKREEIRQQRTIIAPSNPLPTSSASRLRVWLYLDRIPISTAPHIRTVYQFSQKQPELWIDALDAAALLKTRFFHAKN